MIKIAKNKKSIFVRLRQCNFLPVKPFSCHLLITVCQQADAHKKPISCEEKSAFSLVWAEYIVKTAFITIIKSCCVFSLCEGWSSGGWCDTYISVAINPVSSDRNRKRMKKQHRMETVDKKKQKVKTSQ